MIRWANQDQNVGHRLDQGLNVKRESEGKMCSDINRKLAEAVWGREEPAEERPGRTCPQWPKTSGFKIQAVHRSGAIQRSKPGDLGLVPAPYFNDTTYTGRAPSFFKQWTKETKYQWARCEMCSYRTTKTTIDRALMWKKIKKTNPYGWPIADE